METLLLNTTPPPQKTASQSGKSGIESESSDNFSPIMEEAVRKTERSQQQNSSEDKNTEMESTTPTSETIVSSDKDSKELDATTGEIEEIAAEVIAGIQPQLPATVNVATKIPTSTLSVKEESQLISIFDESAKSLAVQKSPVTEGTPGTEPNQTRSAKAESLLSQQIQQILDQGQNNGSIIITGESARTSSEVTVPGDLNNLSNPLLAKSENVQIQTKQIGISLIPTDDTSIASSKNTKLEGSHQDFTEQFLNAKFGDSKAQTGDNLTKNGGEHKGTEQQTKAETITSQVQGNLAADAKPVESSFIHQLNTVSTTSTQPMSIEGKLAPGAHLPVSESDMVNNLVQRFTVNPRLQTSKISMQLHPAELGAIKIDIQVKDDSIKASIVAQSQQVFDTLEKNMPRLRAVLENQGFTVDSFQVVMDDNSGNQHGLFQEQFNSQQQEFASTSSPSGDSDTFDALLDLQENDYDTATVETGVNVTI